MKVEVIRKPRFAVLGIEGSGLASEGPEWIKPLWDTARSRSGEIRDLIVGSGAWGLMSAIDEQFGRWKETGKYLAGWEVGPGIQVPDGWSLWEVPETAFAAIACTMKTYAEAWQYFHERFLPNDKYDQGGAVHEFYPPEYRGPGTGSFYLYFTLRPK